jgi:HKD family nuclease
MEVKFISNNLAPQAHDKHIVKLIENSDEVWIAVAFLTHSGLNKLIDKIQLLINAEKSVYIIAGQNFGHTEPRALRVLMNMFEGKVYAKLYLDKADQGNKVFHPKLYIFRTISNYTIISGSANLTAGGLTSNNECSLQVIADESDTVCKEALDYMKELILPINSNEVDEDIIKEYEIYYEEQKIINKVSKSTPKTKRPQQAIRNYYRVMLGSTNKEKSISARELAKLCFRENWIGTDYGFFVDLTDDFNNPSLTNEDFIEYYTDKFKEFRPDDNANIALDAIWVVSKDLKKGDIVFCSDKKNPVSYYIGEIEGDYYYAESIVNTILPHRRSIRWFPIKPIPLSSLSTELQGYTKRRSTYEIITSFSDEIERLIQNGTTTNSNGIEM